jgi:hypothetical protein
VITQAERHAKLAGDVGLHARGMRRLGISSAVLGRHQRALKILEQVALYAFWRYGAPSLTQLPNAI